MVRIYFRNPPDGGAPAWNGNTWIVDGAFDLATLSLSPSVNMHPLHAHFNLRSGALSYDGKPGCVP
jgi:hypothetical protein